MWPLATSGQVVKQKCPGGAESVGMDVNLLYILYGIKYWQ